MSENEIVEIPDATDVPAEFPTDEHRDGHIAGLIHERESYAARVQAAKTKGDALAVTLYEDRISQVDLELDRIAGKAKTGRARAEKR